jgi:uncharacterized protein
MSGDVQAPPDRAEVIAVLRAHEADLRGRGVKRAGVFGSVARGEARADSDIDILVELDRDRPIGVFEYVAITQFVADLFARLVDVSDRDSLRSRVRPSAERDVIYAF